MPSLRRQPSSDSIRIGSWLLEPSLHALSRGDERIVLRAKLVDVLGCLVESAGEAVTRDELLAKVWGDIAVTEDSLTRAISELRAILGDSHARPRYIETIRKSGYRLVAPVSRAAEITASLEAAPAPPPVRRHIGWIAAVVGVIAVGLLARELAAPRPAETGAPRPLASLAGRETDASLSPDGSQVAFAWGGEDGANYDIYVSPRDGGGRRRITSDPDHEIHPAWSPDGRRIAFVRSGKSDGGIYEVALSGGPPRLLAPALLWSTGLDWSPDGENIVYSQKRVQAEPERIVLLPLGSLEPRMLTLPVHGRRDWDPAFSPGGESIVFLRTDLSGMRPEICIVAVTGGEPGCHPTGGREVSGLDWAGDGAWILVAARAGEGSALFRLSPTSGAFSEIPVRAGRIAYPSLSGDARTLIYEESTRRETLWRLALNHEGEPQPRWERIMASTRSESDAAYAPDGIGLAFVTSRTGPAEIWIADSIGAQPRRLTRTDAIAVSRPRWSSDGRWIAFQEEQEGKSAISIVASGGGDSRMISECSCSLLLSGWSSKGLGIYYAAEGDRGWQIFRQEVFGDIPDRDVVSDGLQAQESRDGRWLYLSRAGEPGIWRQPVGGGPPELVVATTRPSDAGAWTLSGDQLIFFEVAGQAGRLASMDLETGLVTSLAELSRFQSPSLSVSPVSRSILVSRVDYGESDIMMIEGFDRTY
jgi:Tol biopolymer transport system component/DNA-binding winged helix-turn-helix (wHTH) protein